MTEMFELLTADCIRSMKRRSKLYPSLGMEKFLHNFPFDNSNVINKTEGMIGKLTSNQDRWSFYQDHTSFVASHFSPSALCSFFWANHMCANNHWSFFARTNADEEPQTAGLMGAMANTLHMLSIAAPDISEHGEFILYTADCKSDKTESALGTDFGFIIPIGDGKYKVALFQAKKAKGPKSINIARQSPTHSNVEQLTRMLNLEAEHNCFMELRHDRNDHLYDGRLCYYAFWHEPQTYLLPTVVSANAIRHGLNKTLNHDFLLTGRTYPRKMYVHPLNYGMWFAEAMPLLLADPESDFGLVMTASEIQRLLQSKSSRPRKIMGIQIPSRTLDMGDWRDLIPIDAVDKEKFFIGDKIINNRSDAGAYLPRRWP